MKRDAKQLIEWVNKLKSERGTWETHWQEVTDYIIPRKNDITTTKHPGEKRNVHLYDNTAMQSNELLAGALHGMLTSPNEKWFDLVTGDPELDKRDDVRLWLQDSSIKMLNVFNNSNFQTEVHEFYLDLCGLCTASMYIEEHPVKVVNFHSRYVKETLLIENSQGEIDGVIRVYEQDARQLVQEFGKDKLPEKVIAAWEKGDNRKWECVHAVYPLNDEMRPSDEGFLYISQYMIKDEAAIVEEGPYYENPWVCSRWSKAAGEKYGRGPGMTALPEAKTVNLMVETMIIGAQKTIDPPMMAPDDGFLAPIRVVPGSINYYRSRGGEPPKISPIFNDMRIDFGFELTEAHRKRIREAFYVDQLQLGAGPQMTATEVMQRTEDKMRLLGPLLGRQNNEFLRPLVDRVFGIMYRRNMFLAPPEVLLDRNIKAKYSSPIARAQGAREAQDMLRALQSTASFGAIDPSVYDLFNADEAAKILARIYGVPQSVIRSKAEVDRIREQRAKMQQAQVQANAQANAADAAGKVLPAVAQLQSVGK